jgi:hypothetical protein
MLLTENPIADPVRAAVRTRAAEPNLIVRLASGREIEFPISPGKTVIGCGPKCTLRLTEPGIAPVHCVLIRDADKLTLRRWADDTSLNGAPFDEAELQPNDQLTLGEVVIAVGWEPNSESEPQHALPRDEPDPAEPAEIHDDSSSDDIWQSRAPDMESCREVEELLNSAWESNWPAEDVAVESIPCSTQPVEPPDAVRLREGLELARKRCRRLLAAFRSLRAESREQREAAIRPPGVCGEQVAETAHLVEAIPQTELKPPLPNWGAQTPVVDSPWGESWSVDRQPEVGPPRWEATTFEPAPVYSPLDSTWPSDQVSAETRGETPFPESFPGTESETPFAEATGRAAADLPGCAAKPAIADGPAAKRQRECPPQPKSYIEQFAHLFPDEPCTAGALPASKENDAAGVPPPADDSIVAGDRLSSSAVQSTDDEESIEAYMARLMQRLRGESAASAAELAGTDMESQSPLSVRDPEHEPVDEPNSTRETAEESSAVQQLAALGDDPPAELDRLPSRLARERGADLSALREIANETARRAIAVHATRTYRRSAVTKVIVSMLAAMTGLWLMLLTPDFGDMQFLSACILLMVATYWFGQTFQTMMDSIRAKSYDGPQLDWQDEMEEIALPIDIDEDRW